MLIPVRFWHDDGEVGEGLRYGRLGDVVQVPDEVLASASVVVAIDPLDTGIGLVGPSTTADDVVRQRFADDLTARQRAMTLRTYFEQEAAKQESKQAVPAVPSQGWLALIRSQVTRWEVVILGIYLVLGWMWLVR